MVSSPSPVDKTSALPDIPENPFFLIDSLTQFIGHPTDEGRIDPVLSIVAPSAKSQIGRHVDFRRHGLSTMDFEDAFDVGGSEIGNGGRDRRADDVAHGGRGEEDCRVTAPLFRKTLLEASDKRHGCHQDPSDQGAGQNREQGLCRSPIQIAHGVVEWQQA